MKDSERRIAVEDLLRLKRAERPAPEFWSRFESEIRAKQLAAIVVRRPWWDGLSNVFAAVRRNRFPFAAAATLALAWVGVHYAGGLSVAAHTAKTTAGAPVAAAPVQAPAALVAARVEPRRDEVGTGGSGIPPMQRPVVASTASHLTVAPAATRAEPEARTPLSDGIAVALVDYRGMNSESVRQGIFGSDREFESTVASVRQPPAEPLASVDPSGERLERLLAPALPSFSSSRAPLLASDRMKQKASYDRMYESMDRYGTGGMSLEFRF